MARPIIGLTSFSLEGSCLRSAVNQAYIDAVVAAGGTPLTIPLGLPEESRLQFFGMIEGLLLPGGDDVAPWHYGQEMHPALGEVDEARDDLELWFAKRALKVDMPILGICRGIQVLAVAGGGTLYQDLPSQRESKMRHEVREFGRDYLSHSIAIDPGSRLAAALGCSTARVNSFHHQAVERVPEGFAVSAQSDDGIVEGIEAVHHRFVVGVQCHPEEIWKRSAPEFSGLFSTFVESAREGGLEAVS